MAESLPKDLVDEILLGLPVKSLMRFKCVSKRWRSLISDPDFAKSHLQRLKAGDLTPSQRIIMGSPLVTVDYQALDCSIGGGGGDDRVIIEFREPRVDYSSMGTIDYEVLNDGGNAVQKFNEPDKDSSCWKNSDIVGSCDGLVCLGVPGGFLIYNPTTRESRVLPSPHLGQPVYIFRGFGYDSQSDDYKIVGGNCLTGQVAIFSLKSGSWRRIQVQQESHLALSFQGVYWKGALHWLVPDCSKKSVIMSFDLSEEKFHQVLPVPGNITFLGLGIHGSSLSLYNLSSNCEVWIMNEYGGSWTKLCSVLTDRIPGFKFEKAPIAFTRSGKILFRPQIHRMVLFNPKDNTWKRFPIQIDGLTYPAIYLETLVSPYPASEPNVGLDLCSMNL